MNKHLVKNRSLKYLLWLLIAIAIILRVVVYMQNRNLILDEANIARNIYERGFAALALPLSYEQYAPPAFLWIIKLSTLIAGFSEYVLRFYPIVCGVAAVVVFYKILDKLLSTSTIWYALGLFAFSHILIRYASELKQYMPDILITLLLIYLTLQLDIKRYSAKRFIIYWSIIGSLAIGMSMPSVFVLTGVGAYYASQCVKDKSYKALSRIIIPSLIWGLLFLAYYITILAPQANSDYLQHFHHHYFLFATPSDLGQWYHNWHLFNGLMFPFEGLYPYAHDINTILLIIALIAMFRKNRPILLLLGIPVFTLLIAAALDKFSLMPRVSLFIIPILIMIIGYGFSVLFSLRSNIIKGVMVVIGVYIIMCNIRQTINTPFQYEELTKGYQYVLENKLKPNAVALYHSTVPAHIYYTQIHPNKDKWSQFANADQLHWYTNYDSLSWQIRNVWLAEDPYAIIYTNATDEQYHFRDSMMRRNLILDKSLEKSYIKAGVYLNPDKMK